MTKEKKDYELLKNSNLLREFYPTLSGNFKKDLEEFRQLRKEKFNIDPPSLKDDKHET